MVEGGAALAAEYQRKLRTAEGAVALIPSGARITMALAAGAPPAILSALAERARSGGVSDVRLYYLLSSAVAGQSVLNAALADRLVPMSFFHGATERKLDVALRAQGKPAVDILPAHFHQVPRAMCEHVGVDTLIATVSPMAADGNFSLGTSTDYSLAVSRKPGVRLLLEINPCMPRVRGDCLIHVSQATALVEHRAPLLQLPAAARSPVDDAIGATIAGLIDEGACLQMGIGALPDAVCAGLHDHRHLGIHTEMMTSGLVTLMRSGVVDNSRKQIHAGKSIFTFALGDQALYDFLDDNPLVEAHPVDYVNNPCVIARNDRVISVNATTQIDLHGACNSEHVNGRQFSGSGGQLDFVRGAYGSRDGRSIIACHSTAAKGTISRIVPHLTGPATTPRTDTHIVVTEYGWADLKGKSVNQRAHALIMLAHPDFREGLERAAHESGLRPNAS